MRSKRQGAFARLPRAGQHAKQHQHVLSEPYYLDPVNVFLRDAQLVRQVHDLLRGGFFDLFQGRFVVARLGTDTFVGALQLVTQFLFPSTGRNGEGVG